MKKFNLILILFLFFFFQQSSYSSTFFVSGNQNISQKTILSLKPINFDINNKNSIDEFQKKIFESGFFKSVDIKIRENNMYISVLENPLVNFFLIEGEVKSSQLNVIEKNLSIKENNILRLDLIKSDLKYISSQFALIGYLKNEVSYELIELPNNKVNVFYKIKLNNKFKIKNIEFIGDKYFKSSTLKDEVFSSEHGWWKFLSNSTTATENLINIDISRLKKFYLNQGFFEAQINSAAMNIISDNEVSIIYSINSGKKFLFKNIKINNLSNALSDDNLNYIKTINQNLSGSVYSQQKINDIVNLVNKYFTSMNLDLIFDYKLTKFSSNELDLLFSIRNNLLNKTVNKIIIEGNTITEDKVVRNLINFSEGDFFNEKKLLNSINKIKDSAIFKNVNYKKEDFNDSLIDLTISVVEQPTGEISAGAGAGSNGATIAGGINEKNFLGKGINLNSSINIGTQKTFGKISFSNPDYQNSGNTLNGSIMIESNYYTNSNYENKIIGSNISTNYEIYDKIFFLPGISIDYDKVKVSSAASTSVKKREGNFFTNKVFYSLSTNTRDRNFNTKNGYNVGFGQGVSLLSDIPYINNSFFGSHYKTFDDNYTTSAKYKIESINGLGKDIKFSDRLYVSSNNLRGFANRSIGPTIDNDFVGGNYLYYGNLSTTFPNGLPDKWNAITNVFYDIANVFGVDDNSIIDSDKIRSSLGIGFSWISPLGPISLSYAEPLSKASSDKVEQFNFKIGSIF